MVRHILLTGAAGKVATVIRPILARSFDSVRLSDSRRVRAVAPNESVVRADLTRAKAVFRAAAGMHAIVHLGGIAKEAPLDKLLAVNVQGTQHVLDAALAHGIERVALASTMHVLGLYRRDERIGLDSPPRPDSRYALSKLMVEQLGFVAARKHGLRVACLRIGCFEARAEDAEPGAWIGPEDLVALIVLALQHPAIQYEVIHAVAEHDGDDCGQRALLDRFGFRFSIAGPSYADAMAQIPVRFFRDETAQQYRGGVFANRSAPQV